MLYSYCKSHAIGTKLDVFGLYFSFDSFKYINFNLKINLPLLLSEQTTVLGKVFELLKSYDTLTFTNKDTSCKVSHSLQRKASARNISFRDYLRLSYIINSVDKTNLSSYKSPPPFPLAQHRRFSGNIPHLPTFFPLFRRITFTLLPY